MKNRLFITGIGGMTGRILARYSLKKGYVVGGTIHNTFPSELHKLSDHKLLKCYPIDLRNYDDIEEAILDFQPDTVIHLAGKVLGGTDKKVFEYSVYQENISIFNNLLKAVKKLNNNLRFILCSGCLIYDKQMSPKNIKEIPIWELPNIDPIKQPYRASKADQEKILSDESSNIDYIIVRPTQFTGPGKIHGAVEWYIANQIKKIKEGKINKIEVKNKLGEVDLLDVRDVVSAFLTLMEKGKKGEIYHISTGSPVTVEDLVKVFLEITGLPTNIPIIATDSNEKLYFRFSPEKLRKLGWIPPYSLNDALTSYWNYFKNIRDEI